MSQSKLVMVVDDDSDIVEMLCAEIAAEGHESITASNGQECLKRLKEKQPNLIIMDIRMPILDGITTLNKMFEKGDKTPVVIYSGYLDEDTVKMSESLGAAACFSKPFTTNSVQQIIDKYAS